MAKVFRELQPTLHRGWGQNLKVALVYCRDLSRATSVLFYLGNFAASSSTSLSVHLFWLFTNYPFSSDILLQLFPFFSLLFLCLALLICFSIFFLHLIMSFCFCFLSLHWFFSHSLNLLLFTGQPTSHPSSCFSLLSFLLFFSPSS